MDHCPRFKADKPHNLWAINYENLDLYLKYGSRFIFKASERFDQNDFDKTGGRSTFQN